MQAIHHLPLILVVFLLSACSSQHGQEPFVTQTLVPSPDAMIFIATPKKIEVTPTYTLTSTATEQILPTRAPTIADLDRLPKLNEVAMSSADFENLEGLYFDSPVLATDVTNELQGACLWDCVKYRYSIEQGLTIMLLRAGDNQKAFRTAQGLRNDFLKSIHYEYTPNELVDMPQESWLIVHKSSNKCQLNATMGLSYGRVVIMTTLTRVVCEETEFGTYGEVDLYGFAYDVLIYTNAQVDKLVNAGYSK
jgi:hypothetical protein